MSYPFVSLRNRNAAGCPPASVRLPQSRGDIVLPEDLAIVSADGHWEISEDIFYDAFPQSLRDKAPRVWFDRYWRLGDPAQPMADAALEESASRILSLSLGEGGWDLDRRTGDLVTEGVRQEILYPQSLIAFTRNPDRALQERVYRIYNEYIAAISTRYPKRYFGVGICSNWWDPARAHEAIRQIVDLKLKTFMVPTMNPGLSAAGRPISYGGPEMDAFWCEAEAAGLPVAFHVGENIAMTGRGAIGASVLAGISPFRKTFGELVFGGVFDRQPKLKIVFAEGGLHWIPGALQDSEMICDLHASILDLTPKERPTDYWRKNCYATFQNDRAGLKLIDHIGVERVMWASDYPHSEGGWGFGWQSVAAVIDAVGEDAGRRILGANAVELYGLDQ